MLKRGFTLAEVLITIGIIGVVAALSTPAIMRNTQNAKVGPQLAKVATTLETGIQAIMTDQERKYFKDVKSLDESNTSLSMNTKMESIVGNYIKGRAYTKTVPEFVGLNGNAIANNSSFPTANMTAFIFSDKSAIAVPNCTLGDNNGTITHYCPIYALLPGFAAKTQLKMGMDVYPLMVTKEGDVVTPTEVKLDDTNDECTEENILNKKITGLFCVDKIAQNGWKIHY